MADFAVKDILYIYYKATPADEAGKEQLTTKIYDLQQ